MFTFHYFPVGLRNLHGPMHVEVNLFIDGPHIWKSDILVPCIKKKEEKQGEKLKRSVEEVAMDRSKTNLGLN